MVASELDKLEVTAITDAYQALKIVLQRKYGPNSELFEAIEQTRKIIVILYSEQYEN